MPTTSRMNITIITKAANRLRPLPEFWRWHPQNVALPDQATARQLERTQDARSHHKREYPLSRKLPVLRAAQFLEGTFITRGIFM